MEDETAIPRYWAHNGKVISEYLRDPEKKKMTFAEQIALEQAVKLFSGARQGIDRNADAENIEKYNVVIEVFKGLYKENMPDRYPLIKDLENVVTTLHGGWDARKELSEECQELGRFFEYLSERASVQIDPRTLPSADSDDDDLDYYEPDDGED